jgi:hypothetical protein
MSTQDPVIDLMRLVSGFQVSQAISVFAELGIADVLKNDAQHVDAVAQATGCYPRTLYRFASYVGIGGCYRGSCRTTFQAYPAG